MKTWIFIVWFIGAVAAGSSLYRISYEVEQMEAELAALGDGIAKSRESIHALNAEWSYLARPGRIAELSAEFLPELGPLPADRIGRLDDVPRTMPDILDVLPEEELATPAVLRTVQ